MFEQSTSMNSGRLSAEQVNSISFLFLESMPP